MKFYYHKGWWLYNAILMAVLALASFISGKYFEAGLNLLFAYGFMQGSRLVFWLTLGSSVIVFLSRIASLKDMNGLNGTETALSLAMVTLPLAFLLMLWQQIKTEKTAKAKKK